MLKLANIRLFILVLVLTTSLHNINSVFAYHSNSINDRESFSNIETNQIGIKSDFHDGFILTKKSGGRSGGGSFKRKSSGSSELNPLLEANSIACRSRKGVDLVKKL